MTEKWLKKDWKKDIFIASSTRRHVPLDKKMKEKYWQSLRLHAPQRRRPADTTLPVHSHAHPTMWPPTHMCMNVCKYVLHRAHICKYEKARTYLDKGRPLSPAQCPPQRGEIYRVCGDGDGVDELISIRMDQTTREEEYIDNTTEWMTTDFQNSRRIISDLVGFRL